MLAFVIITCLVPFVLYALLTLLGRMLLMASWRMGSVANRTSVIRPGVAGALTGDASSAPLPVATTTDGGACTYDMQGGIIGRVGAPASFGRRLTSAICIAIACAAGCTSLTPGGQRVHVIGDETAQDAGGAPSTCRYIGPVKAHADSTRPGSPLTGNFAVARTSAVNGLRNAAATAGADTLTNVRTESTFWGVDATGDAYACATRDQ